MLGDSFAFGLGAEYESAIPQKLETYLAMQGVAAEVWNLGVPSYGPQQYVATLENYVSYAVPAHVVVCVFISQSAGQANDIYYAARFTDWRNSSARPGLASRAKKHLARNSALFNAFLLRFAPVIRASLHGRKSVDLENAFIMREGWRIFEEQIARLQSLGTAYGFELTVAYIPPQRDILNEYETASGILSRLSTEHGFDFVDGMSLVSRETSDSLYYPLYGHLNVSGYDVFARGIAETISSRAQTR